MLLRNVCQRVPEGQPIVAWHEVPGKAPPQENRPVGYGVIRAGVGTDWMFRKDKKTGGQESGHKSQSDRMPALRLADGHSFRLPAGGAPELLQLLNS
jgi:hypothetical protein